MLSVIFFSVITFYLGFSAAFLFTAKSERAVKSSASSLPAPVFRASWCSPRLRW